MKISVIVPVYNAGDFLDRCIESVLAQSESDWELVAVDDGSKDNSLSILNGYAAKDARIRVFHKENGGAGSARNLGLEMARGEYIVFLDCDDVLEPHYLKELAGKSADVVMIDVQRIDPDGRPISEKMSVYRNLSKDDILRGQMTGKILWGGVRKAVRRELIEKNNIRYSHHTVGEEALYSFLVLFFAESVDFIDSDVYTYFVREDSLSHRALDDPWGDVAVSLSDVVKDLSVYEKYAATLNAFHVTAAVVSLDKIAGNHDRAEYRALSKERIRRMKERIDAPYGIDFAHMDIKAKLMYPLLKSNLTGLFYLVSRLRRA